MRRDGRPRPYAFPAERSCGTGYAGDVTPPRDTEGPKDPTGGDFVLLEPTAVPSEPEPTDLAEGSDVHDVEALGRQLDAATIDAVLRAYLDDDVDVEPLPPPPRGSDRRDR